MALLIALLIISQTTSQASARPEEAAGAVSAMSEDAFAQLKQLVGVWRRADGPQSSLRIRFYLTARGTVLVESWEARGQPHSLTLYHRDGDALLATHYCPQGNQPRLELRGRDGSGLHFTLRDATDLDPSTESHQHDLWFNLTDPDSPVRSEVYSSKGGPGTQERLQLVRDSDAPLGALRP